jgi:hypothetical protein
MFSRPLALDVGDTVTREPFIWADLKVRLYEPDSGSVEAHL